MSSGSLVSANKERKSVHVCVFVWMRPDDITATGESCKQRGSVQSVSETNKTTAEVLLAV